MKQLVLAFEDAEFEALKQAKGSKTWRQFVLEILQTNDPGKGARSDWSRVRTGRNGVPVTKPVTGGESKIA